MFQVRLITNVCGLSRQRVVAGLLFGAAGQEYQSHCSGQLRTHGTWIGFCQCWVPSL
jgi:hypothetical protein